jgi:hypothetical protein
MRAPRIAFAALAFVLLFAGTCKAPAPTSDSTLPSLEWVVRNTETSVDQKFTGSGTVIAKRGESYKVTLKAIDPEGVHEITLGRNATWTCENGGVAQNVNADSATSKQTLDPDSMGNVLTEIFLIRDKNLLLDCQPGFTFAGGSDQLTGSGTNYFGGKTKGTLTFKVPA